MKTGMGKLTKVCGFDRGGGFVSVASSVVLAFLAVEHRRMMVRALLAGVLAAPFAGCECVGVTSNKGPHHSMSPNGGTNLLTVEKDVTRKVAKKQNDDSSYSYSEEVICRTNLINMCVLAPLEQAGGQTVLPGSTNQVVISGCFITNPTYFALARPQSSRISFPSQSPCDRQMNELYNVIKTYEANNGGQSPRSLQELYDATKCNLDLFTCPNSTHITGDPGQIDKWSDYIYVAPENRIRDKNSSRTLLYDRALSNHFGKGINIFDQNGVVSGWSKSQLLHLRGNERKNVEIGDFK